MKVKFISDVHLEFSRFPLIDAADKELSPSKDQVLLVAGDTIPSIFLKEKRTDQHAQTIQWRFNEFLNAVSEFKNVYMIAGNHYEYGDVSTNKEIIQEYIDKKGYTNIKFLENERMPLTDKVDLLASTLWTDMGKGNPSIMLTVNGMMNDFYVSNYKGYKFTAKDAYDLHQESLAFLNKELLDTSKDYLVMTHHCPSFQSIEPCFKGDEMNYGYASDLEDLILSNPHIKNWVHGHTHYNVDYKIGETRIVGNMRGYPPEYGQTSNWKGFKAGKWLEI
jgi:predicted MPP superfamily phosphohydrolase